jgi:hypothetical protein
MGDSRFRSNIKGHDGTETISNFASVSSSSVVASSYIKLGTKKYLFFGDETAEATIVALATAVDASVKGSLYLGDGKLWVFDSDTTATPVTTD